MEKTARKKIVKKTVAKAKPVAKKKTVVKKVEPKVGVIRRPARRRIQPKARLQARAHIQFKAKPKTKQRNILSIAGAVFAIIVMLGFMMNGDRLIARADDTDTNSSSTAAITPPSDDSTSTIDSSSTPDIVTPTSMPDMTDDTNISSSTDSSSTVQDTSSTPALDDTSSTDLSGDSTGASTTDFTADDSSTTLDATTSTDDSDGTDSSGSVSGGSDINSSSTGATTDTSSTTPDDTATDASSTAPNTDPSITTGDATAAADVVNVINTNVVNSEGFDALLNLFEPYIGNIDLSNINFTPNADCSTCDGGSLGVTDENSSTLDNNISVTATSGGNLINASGVSEITTGDATAAANVLNIVNSNIVGSNYLLVVLNDFNQLNGDVVLPGESFFANLLGTSESTPSSATGNLTVTNSNNAIIANTASTTADSGDNTVSNDGSDSVTTGAATSVSNTVNDVNTNITGNTQVYLLVRVFGTWSGNIFGTPAGLQWEQTPDGLLLTGAAASAITDGCGCDASTTVTNTNSADVSNNVQVYALTGQNEITNGSAPASISTGNATAVSNVLNIVNTNIVGQNILLGILNIFGNWQGNLAFGQPDLWTGIQASASASPLTDGSTVNYTVTVQNRGTSDATDVQVESNDSDGNISMATITDAGGGTANDGSDIWNIPDIPAGGSITLNYSEMMNTPMPLFGNGQFTETVVASEEEDDANPADNSDAISFGTWAPDISTGVWPSKLWIKELNSATSTMPPGSAVGYRLLIGNGGNGQATDVFVHETLYDPYGNMMTNNTWELPVVLSGQEYAINYSAGFGDQLHTGWYESYSSLEGHDNMGNIIQTADTVSSSSVYIVNPADYPAPSVASDTTTAPLMPVPVINYVPPQATSTLPTPSIASTTTNVRIKSYPKGSAQPDPGIFSLANSTSCPANAGTEYVSLSGNSNTTTGTKLIASIDSVLPNGKNTASGITTFLTSTALALASVFLKKFW